MNDMKEFWNKWKTLYKNYSVSRIIIESMCEEQGLFFWERGGKQYYLFDKKFYSKADNLKEIISKAKIWAFKSDYNERTRWAMDFLDCVACLGEDKVKELIEDLKGAKTK